MTGKTVESSDYGAFVRRVLRAYSRRVGDGDLGGLSDLVALRGEVDDAISAAVVTLHSEPWKYSWTEIARELGLTRQAVRQRYGSAVAPSARSARLSAV